VSEDRYEKGLAVRREVLGDAYVDRALGAANAFNEPLQQLLNENCWGTLWTRETLPRRTRSLVTLAILTALRAPAELQAHVRGALRNGCTPEEIREVLLHATGYCGFPAGVEAFRAAKEVIDNWEP
jgi:4-carboxymuconolactone decarboxylase